MVKGHDIERETAVKAVLRACHACREIRATWDPLDNLEKSDQSPVTVADYTSQALIVLDLKTTFPKDKIVGEEDARFFHYGKNRSLLNRVSNQIDRYHSRQNEKEILDILDEARGTGGQDESFWVLDPIDGTKGYIRGDQYAIALALVEGNRPVIGVLGCPNLPFRGEQGNKTLGTLFVSTHGYGAWARPLDGGSEEKMAVSQGGEPESARFCESFESSHSSHADAERVARRLGIESPPIRMDSQCKYGVVARGDASIFLRFPLDRAYREKVWDHAAGVVIVEEAGGKVTDVEGHPLDFSRGRELEKNRGIVATNGILHDAVLEAILESGASIS